MALGVATERLQPASGNNSAVSEFRLSKGVQAVEALGIGVMAAILRSSLWEPGAVRSARVPSPGDTAGHLTRASRSASLQIVSGDAESTVLAVDAR